MVVGATNYFLLFVIEQSGVRYRTLYTPFKQETYAGCGFWYWHIYWLNPYSN